MEEQKKNVFTYDYSAEEQKELEEIREKYLVKTKSEREDKLELIRKLDSGVERKGMTRALIVGIISTLILGVGMCCCLVWQETLFVPGIGIGIIGLIGIGLNYPLYNHTIKKEREKVAEQILQLTEELL